jgi:adenylyl-sulfate kinase
MGDPMIESEMQRTIPFRPVNEQGLAIFLTGLSGAGKTTVAHELGNRFQTLGYRVTLLDGDDLRQRLSPNLGFSRSGREANLRFAGAIASEVVKHGGIAICSFIAPYDQSRLEVRKAVEQHGKFFMVFVSTPLQECERRDTKGLYRKARLGLISNFTGISDTYESPKNYDLAVDTSGSTAHDAADRVMQGLIVSGVSGLWVAAALRSMTVDKLGDGKRHMTKYDARYQKEASKLLPQIVEAIATRRKSLSEIACTIGVDRHKIEKSVRLTTGHSFRSLQRRLLLERALLLLRTGRSIKEVAFELGFGSPQSFHRFVRATTGTTPVALRVLEESVQFGHSLRHK